jgi:dTDP-glucose pyrophosphorylase
MTGQRAVEVAGEPTLTHCFEGLVMTGFYAFTPAIFHACHLVQPSDHDEAERGIEADLDPGAATAES